MSNTDALQNTLGDSHADSDLVSGVYEGGLKVWDCAFDLVDWVSANKDLITGKRVLELGCGQGLPGVMALKAGAAKVIFQDFNVEVLDKATKPVIEMNVEGADSSSGSERYGLLAGTWLDLIQNE